MDVATVIEATAVPVYELGEAYYFEPATVAKAESLGLDVFMFYTLGRGGVLGDVGADVAAEAFIWHKPELVRFVWNEGREIADPSDVAVAFLDAARAFARKTFKDTDVLRKFADAAAQVVEAAPRGRWPFVDGYRTFDVPADVPARAYQYLLVLREMRGAASGEAVREVGLTPAEAHYLNSPEMFGLYGYVEDDAPEVSDELFERRAIAEERTSEILVPSYECLDAAGLTALLEGVREMAQAARIDMDDEILLGSEPRSRA
jgi:hypothetical protein